MILAGDIGGTNTRLALFEDGDGLAPVRAETFPSREHASLAAIVRSFLSGSAVRPDRACFGVAGAVRSGRVAATNLPWKLDAAALAAELSIGRVALLNDLEAAGWVVEALAPADVAVLQVGEPDPEGNGAVIAAGTGLGEAGLVFDGRRRRPFASEGGHSDYSPRSEIEVELWRHLAARFGHASWERVVSGPGLVNVHAFLRDTGRGEEPAWLAEEMREGDPAAAVARAALARRSDLAARALEIFASAYGAAAGNLALHFAARAGVWIAGGIAPRVLPALRAPGFLEAFRDKGRFRPWLEKVPVRVVLDERAPLLGAARYALREMAE
jgi:glucokinase